MRKKKLPCLNHQPLYMWAMLQGLKDESSVCVCQTLAALSVCLPDLLECVDSEVSLVILNALPLVASNPYWLVKVVDSSAQTYWLLGNLCTSV